MKTNYFNATSKNRLSKMKKYLKTFLEFSRKYFHTNEDFLIFQDFTADTFIISCYCGFN
jgi:hypothetical protein